MPDSEPAPDEETIAFSSSPPSTGDNPTTIVSNRDINSPSSREKDLFFEALDIEIDSDRSAFLEKACGDDKVLRQRIEDLLNLNEKTGFLEPRETVKELNVEIHGKERELPPTSNNYEVGLEIARGGMGSIRVAEDNKLRRSVAIKVMHRDAAASSSAQARFLLEAEVLAELAHPNIVPIHDIVWEDGCPLFYSMKLVKGRTLQAIIDELRDEKGGEYRRI
ncbi:MAG: protein kinase [Verrucomicrobiales bacterium]|nr:protein kinase [Verrucomicrobiales bacterium]